MVTIGPQGQNPFLEKTFDRKKITSVYRSRIGENQNQMTETAENANGETIKVSVFTDKNRDGKFTPDEVTSVTYYDVGSRSLGKTEYRDTDGDGYCDEVAKSNFLGESVEKVPDREQTKMDIKYGFKWDASKPAEPAIHMTPYPKNSKPIHYDK